LQVRSRVDLSHVRTRAGDFDLTALSLAVDTPGRNQLLVRAWQQYAAGRPTVAFTVDVAHAQHVAAAFQDAGVPADWVAGSLRREDRARRLAALRTGQIQVLANAMLLTEGWDEPRVAAVLLARPTKSRPLWIQMVGRGLRLAPDKTDCLVLDVADNRHDLVTLSALQDLGVTVAPTGPRTAPTAPPHRDAPDPADDLPLTATLVATPRDLLTRSAFAWQRQGDRLTLQAGPGRRVQLVPEGEGYRVQAWAGSPIPLHPEPLPLEYAQGVAEDWVRGQGGAGFARKDARWRRLPPSAKQVALAKVLGVTFPDGTTREGAHDALEAAMAHARLRDPEAPWRQQPASAKQRAWLEAHHIHVRENLTKGEAADLMNRILGRSS
jgi:ATP-dependent helicase IRC3